MTSARVPGIPRWVGARLEFTAGLDFVPDAPLVCLAQVVFPHPRRARAWGLWLLLTRRGGRRATA